MAIRTPLFYDSTLSVHRPIDNGDLLPVTAIPLSASLGNRVVANTDGLYYGDYSGTVLYVDSVAGNDTNPGTKVSPFLTIAHATAYVSSLFPGSLYKGSNITIALKANQNYPWTTDFSTYRGSDITFAFYGDPNYGDFNSPAVGTGCNPGNMINLQRPVIQPQSSNVNAQWKLAGINRLGGTVYLYGVTISLPAAPASPSLSLYGGYVDFIRCVANSEDGTVSTAGVVINMTDTNAYWGFMGIHSRSFTKFYQFATQFQINGLKMSAANSPTTAQLGQRQYFFKFFMDAAGNNQTQLNVQTTSLNSSTGSGQVMVDWSDTEALVVTGSTTNLDSYPLAFDPSYGLTNYVFNLNRTSSGVPLNFISSRII